MTPMKLQKLLYYCQAWHLVCEGARLFNEDMEAWPHGPVVRSVYVQHAGTRNRVTSWPSGSSASVAGASAELIKAVLAQYGSLTAAQLRNLSHSEAPWDDAHATGSKIIADSAMREFYAEELDTAMDLRLAEQAERTPEPSATLDEVAAELGWW